jgi:hypothetical protein
MRHCRTAGRGLLSSAQVSPGRGDNRPWALFTYIRTRGQTKDKSVHSPAEMTQEGARSAVLAVKGFRLSALQAFMGAPGRPAVMPNGERRVS